jgi:predicted O-methyltransferase YrrM
MAELEWTDENTFVLGGATFKTAPVEVFVDRGGIKMGEADFLVAKPRHMVERYAALIEELRPERILELGSFQGGSTAMLLELARPKRLVSVDRLSMRKGLVERHAAGRGFEEVVRIHGNVDQADRQRLAEIATNDFDDGPLDLIIDDCSHEYEPSRASFNELFPRLRPGGIYVLEDWPWVVPDEAAERGEVESRVALMRLLFEATASIPYHARSIDQLLIERESAFITRGAAELKPGEFEIARDLGFCGSDLVGATGD